MHSLYQEFQINISNRIYKRDAEKMMSDVLVCDALLSYCLKTETRSNDCLKKNHYSNNLI